MIVAMILLDAGVSAVLSYRRAGAHVLDGDDDGIMSKLHGNLI